MLSVCVYAARSCLPSHGVSIILLSVAVCGAAPPPSPPPPPFYFLLFFCSVSLHLQIPTSPLGCLLTLDCSPVPICIVLHPTQSIPRRRIPTICSLVFTVDASWGSIQFRSPHYSLSPPLLGISSVPRLTVNSSIFWTRFLPISIFLYLALPSPLLSPGRFFPFLPKTTIVCFLPFCWPIVRAFFVVDLDRRNSIYRLVLTAASCLLPTIRLRLF